MNYFSRLKAAVQNLGFSQTMSAYVGATSYIGGGGKNLSLQDGIRNGYKNVVWVHRCIQEIGRAVGSVPWKAGKLVGNNFTHIPGHPLEKLLERPNPYTTRKEFMDGWACYLQLGGRVYWEVVQVAGKPQHLYTVRPDWLKPIPDKLTYVSGYKFMPNGVDLKLPPIPPESIIDFRYIDPEDAYGALSPLTAAARTIDTESGAINWNKALLDNSAIPGGVLKVPTTGLGKPQRDKLKEDIDKNFAGMNRFRTMVLWGNMEWSKMALTAQEMDFAKLRQLNKFEICAIHGIPPQVVGANEDPTYANYEIARQAFWEDTIIPMLEWLQAKINLYLAPYFGDGIVVRYDVSDVPAMRASFEKKVATAKDLYNMGVPFNDINRRLSLGFPEFPWGSIWWAPMNLMPVNSDTAPVGSPINPSPDQLQPPTPLGDQPPANQPPEGGKP